MLCYLTTCMCLRENFPGMPGPLNSFVVDSGVPLPSSRRACFTTTTMSFSPPRHIGATNGSSGNSSSQNYSPMCRRHQEDLINAYEAEEERIINVLSRKLEQVCEALWSKNLLTCLQAQRRQHPTGEHSRSRVRIPCQ